MEKKIVIHHENGLHARPAGVFVKKAMGYQSKVEVKAKGKVVNGKSLMALLSLGLDRYDEIELCVEGDDQEKAFSELEALLIQTTSQTVSATNA